MSLTTQFAGVTFENPFVLASAPPTANADLIRRGFEAGWAGAVVKTLTRDPVSNFANRFAVLRHNRAIVGFENLELLSEHSPEEWFGIIAQLKAEFPDKILIGSIMGDARSYDNWVYLAKGCQQAGADMIELNFSCPHGYPEKGRGAAIGQNADYSAEITRHLAQCSDLRLPLIPKLTGAVADIQHIGEAVAEAGAHGLCAINTIPSLFGVNLKTLRPKPDIHGMTSYGGYSGQGIKPIALRAVACLCQSPALPVMACGGVTSGFDAAEFMLLGAPLVEVCTEVMLHGFGVVSRMRKDLETFMGWHNFTQTADFIGLCRDKIAPFSRLSHDTSYSPRLLSERCKGCGTCVISCRDGAHTAIRLRGGKAEIEYALCIGCSLCSLVCPEEAIVMVEGQP